MIYDSFCEILENCLLSFFKHFFFDELPVISDEFVNLYIVFIRLRVINRDALDQRIGGIFEPLERVANLLEIFLAPHCCPLENHVAIS